MNRFLIGLFILTTTAMVGLAAYYPEDFALALGSFVVGLTVGSTAAYHVYTTIHDRGFQRSQDLSMKQVVGPASILREERLALKQSETKQSNQQQQAPPPQQQAIPRFSNIVGLDN